MAEINRDITRPGGDGSTDRPPNGDDYNELWDAILDEIAAAKHEKVPATPTPSTDHGGPPLMTDRHAGYVVTLDSPVREDDAESTINAIRHIKGVADVQPIQNSPAVTLAKSSARMAILKEIAAIYNRFEKGEDQ